MEAKFEVGDKVKISSDGRVGKILTVLFDSTNGLRYRVSQNVIDSITNEIVSGAITLTEDDIELFKEEKNGK